MSLDGWMISSIYVIIDVCVLHVFIRLFDIYYIYLPDTQLVRLIFRYMW